MNTIGLNNLLALDTSLQIKPFPHKSNNSKLDFLLEDIKKNLELYKKVFDLDSWYNDKYYCELIYKEFIKLLEVLYNFSFLNDDDKNITWTYNQITKSPLFLLWFLEIRNWKTLDSIFSENLVKNTKTLTLFFLSKFPWLQHHTPCALGEAKRIHSDSLELKIPFELTWNAKHYLNQYLSSFN